MAKITRTWWGESFLLALENSLDSGRLSRGRAYSSPGRLVKFTIKNTTIKAHIKGNKNPYFGVYETPCYDTKIQLTQIPKEKWQAIVEDISNNAALLSRLLMHEMPDTIEAVFDNQQVSLLPESGSDLVTSCSCPDWSNPCKHIAGSYYKVASLLDRDPFLLFQLRGMDKTSLHQALAQSPLGKALLDQWNSSNKNKPNLSAHAYTQPLLQKQKVPGWQEFWQTSQPLPEITQTAGKITAALIKKGGDYPAFWERDNSFVEAMESFYTSVAKKNQKLL